MDPQDISFQLRSVLHITDQETNQNLYQNFFDPHDSNHHHIHVRADPRITAEFLALHCLTDSGALGFKLD